VLDQVGAGGLGQTVGHRIHLTHIPAKHRLGYCPGHRPGGGAIDDWYRDAIIYELPVRAFSDTNADGVGDFPGLTGKLDYFQDLGVTAIWLLPFYPSDLRDDGYDIRDYTGIHSAYGTMDDFRVFLKEAHSRGLRVITELVLNHTSARHPWFERARRAPRGSVEREFYVWSDTADRYGGARVIFTDFESCNWAWDPVAGAYYWHRFYRHQPDLNFDNPVVRREILAVVDSWLEQGVDGLRLDAVPYLFEREGTSCENLPETHAFLGDLRAHVDARFPGRMLLAEANQRPEDAAAYFGCADQVHMAFHFPLMPRMFMAVAAEDRGPIIDALDHTPPIPEPCQWALFLRNHDELSLEMVSDWDREAMYRAYAPDPRSRLNLGIRRRLAPLMGHRRSLIELMNGLLFSLAGTPVVYYGDEIGMGDDLTLPDRHGIRTPMQWTSGRNAGFSGAAGRLCLPIPSDGAHGPASVNVESQRRDAGSLWHWMRRLIHLRRRTVAFSRGTLEVVGAGNHRVLAFLREHGEERVLVVANLSAASQEAALDLARFHDAIPRPLLGRTTLPRVDGTPYRLTLDPHAFAWLRLESAAPLPTRVADGARSLEVAR
jgi:maltose alpha-D-glucosyltransferase/alpha-amylase